MEWIPEWQIVLVWSGVVSVVTVVLTIAAIPWIVGRLPHDYFARARRESWRSSSGAPLVGAVIDISKNIVGCILVVLGFVMLVTPGQGVLTILVGLLLMNFPGKYALERWLVNRPGVLRALNWLRMRSGQRPFDSPPS